MQSRNEYFDSIAGQWDGLADIDELRARLEDGQAHLALDGAEDVVDLGCGTGNLTAFLLARAPDLRALYAVDFSARMLEMARSKIDDPRVRWMQEDAARLSLPPESVDLVICFSAWPHFPDPGAVLARMHRVLRPGGRFVVYHVASRETINDIHRGVGGLIAEDVLPPATELAASAGRRGFDVDAVLDTADEYLVSARKVDG